MPFLRRAMGANSFDMRLRLTILIRYQLALLGSEVVVDVSRAFRLVICLVCVCPCEVVVVFS